MNTRNLLILMAFGGVVALAACSTAEADKFGSSDSFCDAKADAECMNLAAKCGATTDACKTLRVSACKTAAATASGGGRSYVANAAQACIDSINDTYKNGAASVSPDAEVATTKVCDRVFRGSKAERDPCGSTGECSGSLICDTVCATEETVSLNGGCGNAGQVCGTGTYCQDQGGKKFCLSKEADGAICAADKPCIETDRCVNHCVPRATSGQACNTDDDCASVAPYCDTTSSPKKCRPKYESTSGACKDFGSGG